MQTQKPASLPVVRMKSLRRAGADDVDGARRNRPPERTPTAQMDKTKKLDPSRPLSRKRQNPLLRRWPRTIRQAKLLTVNPPSLLLALDAGQLRSADVDVNHVMNASRSPSANCWTKVRKFLCRSPKSRLLKKARALLRTSLCQDAFWFTCQRSSTSAYRARLIPTLNGRVCAS